MNISPSSGNSIPAIQRSRVDLPEPLGPQQNEEFLPFDLKVETRQRPDDPLLDVKLFSEPPDADHG